MTKRIKICEGNTYHEVEARVEDQELNNDYTHMIYKKGVWLFNMADPEYYQVFQSPEELDEFIEKLNKARKEVFGA